MQYLYLMLGMQTDSLQDAKRLANNLLKEKSDWMEKERELDRTQKLLVEAESKVISHKVCWQTA